MKRKTASQEQRIFWGIFDEKLIENGEPFGVTHQRENGDPTYWGNVNRKKAFGPDKTLGIEFKYQTRKIRIGIYLWDDICLFEQLYANKTSIENELGFSMTWEQIGAKNPNTRRIYIEFPLLFSEEYYGKIIDEILPYLQRCKEVFEKWIPNLFDM